MTYIGLLAEASPRIGTGHVVETFHVARAALKRGLSIALWVNREAPDALSAHAPVMVYAVEDFSPENLRQIGQYLETLRSRLAVTNFRRVHDTQVAALRWNGAFIACVDELGNTHLDCDLVINNSIVSAYHRYTSHNPAFRICAGPAYMAMSEEYGLLHTRLRAFSGPIRTVAITMGGNDPHGTTIRILDALKRYDRPIVKHVIMGAGFPQTPELESRAADNGGQDLVLHRNLRSLGELLAQSDVGFTVGGNTLYEMACVGTPALVLYDEPHEREQAEAFEAKGFGKCIGWGPDTTGEQIIAALKTLEDPALRTAWSEAGRALVDGHGAERIIDAITEFTA